MHDTREEDKLVLTSDGAKDTPTHRLQRNPQLATRSACAHILYRGEMKNNPGFPGEAVQRGAGKRELLL